MGVSRLYPNWQVLMRTMMILGYVAWRCSHGPKSETSWTDIFCFLSMDISNFWDSQVGTNVKVIKGHQMVPLLLEAVRNPPKVPHHTPSSAVNGWCQPFQEFPGDAANLGESDHAGVDPGGIPHKFQETNQRYTGNVRPHMNT